MSLALACLPLYSEPMITNDEVKQVNVSIPYFTGIPEDVIQNTFHFIFDDGVGTAPNITDYGNLADNLKAFYDTIYTAAGRAPWVTSAMNMKFYDLTQPTPRVPVFSANRTSSVTATANATAPPEIALCVSIRGDYIGGIPQARQRGRIFIGGMAGPTTSGTASSFPEVPTSVRSAAVLASSALRTACLADNWTWVILSPTQVAAAGKETFDVAHGWVDNAPDTQRRRGTGSTARTSW